MTDDRPDAAPEEAHAPPPEDGPPAAAAPPEPAPTPSRLPTVGDGRLRRQHPAHVRASRLGGLIFTGFVALALPIVLLVVILRADPGRAVVFVLIGAVLLVLALLGLAAWGWPVLDYRNFRWRLDDEGLEIQRGVVWKHVVSVPHERIQHTDVTRGPIERRFGLATLVVHTAGTHNSEIHLPGVTNRTALAIRRHLLQQGEGEDEDDD